jgi:hypothetical protein
VRRERLLLSRGEWWLVLGALLVLELLLIEGDVIGVGHGIGAIPSTLLLHPFFHHASKV